MTVEQRGKTFYFTFTLPQLATDGGGLTKPVEVEVYRVIAPAGMPVAKVAPAQSPWLTLLPQDLAKHTSDGKVFIASSLSTEEYTQSLGSTFIFTARALTRGFRHRAIRGEASNAAPQALLDVSPPLQGLKVTTTEKALILHWAAPAEGLSGKAVSGLRGYRVYRSAMEGSLGFRLVGEPQEPSYLDPDFAFGKAYSYKVRAVFERDKQMAESEDSGVVKITPKDVFPPAAPTGLAATYVSGAVEVVWNANTESDLGGYNIYRRGETGPFEKINKALLLSPVFRDSAVAAGHTYYYQASAVDLAGNESARSQEVSVETQ